MKNFNINTLLIVLAIIAIAFLAIKILNRTKKTGYEKRSEKKTSKQSVKADIYFNPKYSKTMGTSLNKDTSDQLAKDFRKSVKGAGTKEELLFGTLNAINTKAELSQVAGSYKNLYNADLLTDILNDLSKTEKARLLRITDNLPNF